MVYCTCYIEVILSWPTMAALNWHTQWWVASKVVRLGPLRKLGTLYLKSHTHDTLSSAVCSAVFLFLSSLYRDRPPDAYASWLNSSLDMVQSAVTGKQTNLCSSWGCLGFNTWDHHSPRVILAWVTMIRPY